MEVIELRQTRELRVGDILVSASDRVYEVTKVTRVGRGIRVQGRRAGLGTQGAPQERDRQGPA